MFHSAHQLAATCVCLLFGAQQVVYFGSLELFCCKKLPAVAKNNPMKVVRLKQMVMLQARQLNDDMEFAK